jgi:AcrR family transcriptional regulator
MRHSDGTLNLSPGIPREAAVEHATRRPRRAAVTTNRQRTNGRRAPAEVQNLILRAADHLFSTQGYHRTTTREIADEAGVGESMIFRNFGTKAELFETVVVAPFTEFVNSWAATWGSKKATSSDAEMITRAFVKGFYTVIADHRDLLQTLLAARFKGGDPALAEIAERVSGDLAQGLTVVRRVMHDVGAVIDLRDADTPLSVAIAAGSMLSLVLLDDWLFPPRDRRPGKARQIEELTQMLLYGVSQPRPTRPE